MSIIKRFFTKAGKPPFDQVEWEPRTVTLKDEDTGNTLHEEVIEAPSFWTDRALKVAVTRYFRYKVGDPRREKSIRDLIHRVVNQFVKWHLADKKKTARLKTEAEILYDELSHICLHQLAVWNSPVWFNFGVPEQDAQAHACFITHVDDSLLEGVHEETGSDVSIAGNLRREMAIFSNGSGIGWNGSSLRASCDHIASGGKSSGPISFMCSADYSAGKIKSGGRTRRAARMQVLDAWHWDLRLPGENRGRDFITIKAFYERMAHDLVKLGWSNQMDGPIYSTMPMQNSNLSVRARDEFMQAVRNKSDWVLHGTQKNPDGSWAVSRKVGAHLLYEDICAAAHGCGDPGMQFADTINAWHTCRADGEIVASNPCCFVGTTLVDTSEGRIRFDELERMCVAGAELPYVFAFDRETGMPVMKPIRRVWRAGETRQLVRVETDKGVELVCTPEHRFLLHDGSYVEAQNLESGSRLRKIARSVNQNRSERRVIYHRTTEHRVNGVTPQAVFMWEQVNGPVPDMHHVHHINGDPTDDRLSNLELMYSADHYFEHSAGAANPRYINVDERALVETWEAIEATPNQKGGPRVTPTRWNSYIRRNGLRGTIPLAASPSRGGRIRGMSWNDFATWIESNRCLTNDCVRLVQRIEYTDPVAVYDLEVADVHNFAVTNSADTASHTIVVHNSEYLFLNYTACNLAQLNLLGIWRCAREMAVGAAKSAGAMFFEALRHIAQLFAYTMDLLIDPAAYPDELIAKMTKRYRTLGVGYTNLGGLLMALGIQYDGEDGRRLAAVITAAMHFSVWEASAQMAEDLGPFEAYERNSQYVASVLDKHVEALNALGNRPSILMPNTSAEDLLSAGLAAATEAAEACMGAPIRNAQATTLAPCGTTSIFMDCDTTGVECANGLVEWKSLSGGGELRNDASGSVREGLEALSVPTEIQEQLIKALQTGADDKAFYAVLKRYDESLIPVFETAFGSRPMSHSGALAMLSEVQPFISGGISKTINLPESATVQDVKDIYMRAWRSGLKCISVYRDGSKAVQAVSTKRGKAGTLTWTEPEAEKTTTPTRTRNPMPSTCPAVREKFKVGGKIGGYLHFGFYPDTNKVGEVFITCANQGDTVNGFSHLTAKLISLLLQHDIEIEEIAEMLENAEFAPRGMTGNKDIPFVKSIPDYVGKRLRQLTAGDYIATSEVVVEKPKNGESIRAIRHDRGYPSMIDCPSCGTQALMISPSCHQCPSCGWSEGGCGA